MLVIPPHGCDTLTPLLINNNELTEALAKAKSLARLNISSREYGDLLMLGIGGFTPLSGFMGHDDWLGVCQEMRLQSGCFWPIPITLSADKIFANGVKVNQEIALYYQDAPVAILKLQEKYSADKAWECREVFKTTDEKHPGVQSVLSQGEINLSGEVVVLSQGDFKQKYGEVYLSPQQTRDIFAKNKWHKIVAFQTRNPMHRCHEYLVSQALENSDAVFIHSLLGELKAGDIPADIRVESIKALLDNYFQGKAVLQGGYPLDMRYAGPREALLHALFRQNYGCSHLIVGRDHAGVGDYYGPFEAQEIFRQIPEDAIQIKMIEMDWAYWCEACQDITSPTKCFHGKEHQRVFSGTALRDALANNHEIPDYVSRPEVLAILREYYQR